MPSDNTTNGLNAEDTFNRGSNHTEFRRELNELAKKRLKSQRADWDVRTRGGSEVCSLPGFPDKPYQW